MMGSNTSLTYNCRMHSHVKLTKEGKYYLVLLGDFIGTGIKVETGKIDQFTREVDVHYIPDAMSPDLELTNQQGEDEEELSPEEIQMVRWLSFQFGGKFF